MSKYLQESYDALLKENSEIIEQNKKLLQRLERYEKALNKITEEIIIESDEPVVLMGKAAIAIGTMRKTAEEALKE